MSDHTHRYSAKCSWRGSTGVGYDEYDRGHTAVCPPALASAELSADPGLPRRPGPAQPGAAAGAGGQLVPAAVVPRGRRSRPGRRGVLADDATGEMPDGRYPWIERIVLRPSCSTAATRAEERVAHLLELAHEECYIANSLRTEITIEPRVERIS